MILAGIVTLAFAAALGVRVAVDVCFERDWPRPDREAGKV